MAPKAVSKAVQGTNTSTKTAYLVVMLAVGVSLYAVHTQRDLVELAAPAVAWSQHQLAAVGEKLPWLRAGTTLKVGRVYEQKTGVSVTMLPVGAAVEEPAGIQH